jgi:tetratricopeptide (TPR) repeat protein
MGRPKDAEQFYDEAYAILTSAFGENSPALAGIMNNKALLLLQLGRIDEAEKLLTNAIGLLRVGAGTETPALAIALNNFANVQEGLGRHEDADRLREQSRAINTKIFGRTAAPTVPAAVLPLWTQDL